MNFFSYNEIFLTCPDSAAVYTYSLFSVHHEIMQYIVFILIFVYWLLYKIIKDFDSNLLNKVNYNIFNNIFFFLFNSFDIFLISFNYYILRPFFWFYNFCIFYDDIYIFNSKTAFLLDDSNTSIIFNLQLFFIKSTLKIYSYFFFIFLGFNSKNIYTPFNYIDLFGRDLFNSEVFLFSPYILEEVIFDFSKFNFSYNNFAYLNTEREIYNLIYYKKTNAFFYNGLININNYIYFFSSNNLKSSLGLSFYENSAYNNVLNYIGLKLLTLSSSNYTSLEYAWLVGPTIFIYLILGPSIMITYAADAHNAVQPSITYKVTAHQWFWQYEHFVDQIYREKGYSYYALIAASQDIYSNIITSNELHIGETRLRMTNNPLIVPMHQTLRFLITSNDVLHAFGIPELGIKLDAVPGRINAVSTIITKPGVYFGACYEICGVYHGFMPINIIALPWNVYDMVVANNITIED